MAGWASPPTVEAMGTMSGRDVGRRTVLLAGAGAAASLLAGCGEGADPATGSDRRGQRCVPRDTLTRRARIGGSALVYELTSRASAFHFDEGFHDELTDWLADWSRDHATPDEIWTYGAFVDGRPECDSLHAAGRAFDISRLRRGDGDTVSCRYDQWRDEDAGSLAARQRAYWALAASLHARFSYVLTYLYDEPHHTHLHVDNAVSRGERPTFRPGSRTQCQSVQAICTHLWGRPLETTGTWDDATRATTSDVLAGLGRTGTLASGDNWVAFCEASARRA